MYKHLKRRDIFEVVRDCAVNSSAAKEGCFQRSAVDERTRFCDLGMSSETDIIALCYNIERKIGYRARRENVARITINSTIGDAVDVFHVDY